ncbi:universal stress protein [Pontibacter ruber]|uniref:Universal stress protein n=1 Tax=Pontibacter ruber TaxID=1343895 RepID=A0ABW5CRW8_9BACT|nr:universal stress protein [Pontibacter ruber]
MFRILTPTDFSTDAFNATLVAMKLAQRFGGELILTHVLANPPVPASAPSNLFASLYEEEERQVKKRLHEEYKHLLTILDIRFKEVRFNSVIVPYPFAESILQVIRQYDINLVVMGSSGAGTYKRVLLGSNTLELLRVVTKPLLIMPTMYEFDGFKNITILLHAEDTTYRSGIELLVRFAISYNARISILFISADPENIPDHTKQLHLQEEWQTLLKLPVQTDAFDGNDTVQLLEQHVKRNHTDLLVVLPRRKSFWEELFTNSVTEELAAQARLPMLVLPVED